MNILRGSREHPPSLISKCGWEIIKVATADILTNFLLNL